MTRSAGEIGAGLDPARPARPIRPGERVHVIGVAGAGASAAALLAHAAGAEVSGCDAGGPSPYTPALEANGIPLAWEHDADHVRSGRSDRLAVTKALTAVTSDHPELEAARVAGVPVEAWQQVVADAAATTGQRLVAVAGTHGKSTTTSWLVHVLVQAGRDPSAFVGALLPAGIAGDLGKGHPATARWGRGPEFVVEADEYAGNFDPFRPSIAVLVTAEWDHPDVFADEGAVFDAFASWLDGAGEHTAELSGMGPIVVANVGDPGVRAVLARLRSTPKVVTFMLDGSGAPDADGAVLGALESADPGGSDLIIAGLGSSPLRVHLGLAGRHNAVDALAVAATASTLGVPAADIAKGLESFSGASRRLELKGEVGGVAVLDDYGHHPTAIAATLQAARQRFPGRRLWAVYEPLTYHRTAAFADAFADVLATADAVAIADIWAGRDQDTTIASAAELARAVNRRASGRAQATGPVEETAHHLATHVRPGDVVVVMGGGRSYRIAELLLAALGATPRLH